MGSHNYEIIALKIFLVHIKSDRPDLHQEELDFGSQMLSSGFTD